MPNGQIISQYPEAPYTTGGVASTQLKLLDAIAAVSVGWWKPWTPFRNGSFEVTNTGTLSATVKLWTSNNQQMPGNGYTITVGGTAHTGDVCTITLAGPSFLSGQLTASYTVLNTDTTTTIATALAAALNVVLKAQTQQLIDSQQLNNQASQITISNLNSSGAATTAITVMTNSPLVEYFDCSESVTGSGATTTLTIAGYDSGDGFVPANCSVTTAGNVPFSVAGTWIKASCPTYSTGTITAIVQGTLP